LVRVKIGNWTLEGIEPGKYKTETIHLPKSTGGPQPRPNQRRAGKPTMDAKADARGNNPNKAPGEKGQVKSGEAGRALKAGTGKKPGAPGSRAKTLPKTAKPTTQTVIIQKPKPKITLDPK
jgi:23S rRNA pseudouridine2457 synthase